MTTEKSKKYVDLILKSVYNNGIKERRKQTMKTQKIEVKFFNKLDTETHTTAEMDSIISGKNVEYITDHETGEILYDNTGFLERYGLVAASINSPLSCSVPG